MIVGMPAITSLAYRQSKDRLREAEQFATATVFNGLGRDHGMSDSQIGRLRAQIERDYLVAIMGHNPEPGHF